MIWNAVPVHLVTYYWSRATKFMLKLDFSNIEDDVVFAEDDVIFAEDDIFVEDDVIFAKMTSFSIEDDVVFDRR